VGATRFYSTWRGKFRIPPNKPWAPERTFGIAEDCRRSSAWLGLTLQHSASTAMVPRQLSRYSRETRTLGLLSAGTCVPQTGTRSSPTILDEKNQAPACAPFSLFPVLIGTSQELYLKYIQYTPKTWKRESETMEKRVRTTAQAQDLRPSVGVVLDPVQAYPPLSSFSGSHITSNLALSHPRLYTKSRETWSYFLQGR
jgi:hypothetical protein